MKNNEIRKDAVQAGILYRAAELGAINEDDRTVELSFSSEASVDRYFGAEILDHTNKSVMLDWFNTGRAPLLSDHDTTKQVGIIQQAEIGKDRRGKAVVRFGKGAQADAEFQDVKDGIRVNVSVGYRIHQMILEEENGSDAVYRVTKWEPLEISLVSIPADQSVGVGRSTDEKWDIEIIQRKQTNKTEIKIMDNPTPATATVPAAAAINEATLRAAFAKENETRTNEIMALAKRHNMIDKGAEFIATNKSADEFRTHVLENIGAIKPISTVTQEVGLSDKEARNFSFLRAIAALANPTDRKAQEAAKFERECSEAAAAKYGKEARGFLVPNEVLKRDLLVGTPTAGGNLVQTDLLAGSFIDVLRNKLILNELGITTLTGLQGPVAIPRKSASSTAYWVAENGAVTESQPAFDQVTMSPKTVGALVDISRRMFLQSSPDIESLVRMDIIDTLAVALDAAGISGTGASNQPRGILNTAGIGSVAGGTNGANVNWQNIVDLEAAVATANADIGNLGYLSNAKQRGKFKGTTKTSPATSFIWDGGEAPVNGYKCGISSQVPSNLTKGTSSGVCSAILFGNWADLVLGLWGGLDLIIDNSTGSAAGTVRVVALQDADFGVRQAASFAAMQDAL